MGVEYTHACCCSPENEDKNNLMLPRKDKIDYSNTSSFYQSPPVSGMSTSNENVIQLLERKKIFHKC